MDKKDIENITKLANQIDGKISKNKKKFIGGDRTNIIIQIEEDNTPIQILFVERRSYTASYHNKLRKTILSIEFHNKYFIELQVTRKSFLKRIFSKKEKLEYHELSANKTDLPAKIKSNQSLINYFNKYQPTSASIIKNQLKIEFDNVVTDKICIKQTISSLLLVKELLI